jgi:probable F420-dependent oxidoreductase
VKFVISTSFSSVSHLTALAPVADSHGWHAMSFSDHVVNPQEITTPYPYTENGERRWQSFTDWPDPWVMIGALAAITKRLRFTNNIFVLPMRNPYLTAKAISTAAIISNNRVTPAIGVGWSSDEFELMQQDFTTRGKRTDEILEIMRLLWTGKMVEYHGSYYQFNPMEMNPAPSEYIPIWIGGISNPAMKRAARLGDGPVLFSRELGRQNELFEVMATPSDVYDVDGYKRLEDAGVTHILTMPWPFYHGETDELDKKIDGLKRYSDDVISHFI